MIYEIESEMLFNEPENPYFTGKFTDLVCWQKCRDLRIQLKEIVENFPPSEKIRLVDQIIRASRSTTNNIAEGFGRFHYRESIKFFYISRGSLFELIDHLIIAEECNYISHEVRVALELNITESIKVLNGYINYIQSKIKP